VGRAEGHRMRFKDRLRGEETIDDDKEIKYV
jgi:hypothetical protein